MSATNKTAILICAIAASTRSFLVEFGWQDVPGGSEAAWQVAFAAFAAAGDHSGAARWAEAEAALRTKGGR